MFVTKSVDTPREPRLREEAQELKIEDLGLAHWETSQSRPSLSNKYFEAYLARPRGSRAPFAFLLKALRPRYCGLPAGPALVERERSLGSIDCRRLLPVVDAVYPKRVSETQSTRGFIVSPCFRGRTLAQLSRKNVALDSKTLESIEAALREIADALGRRAWALGSLSPEQILVSDGRASNVALIDYSTAFRFANVSLLKETFAGLRSRDVSFDPEYLLSPDAFYRADLDRDSSERVIENFLRSTLRQSRL
ncbi:MAG: hypothetical protein J6X44_01650 [Thermoguttaceae bacterium]|nr:hypothetical protein [Thermoguttaceae bacterium]